MDCKILSFQSFFQGRQNHFVANIRVTWRKRKYMWFHQRSNWHVTTGIINAGNCSGNVASRNRCLSMYVIYGIEIARIIFAFRNVGRIFVGNGILFTEYRYIGTEFIRQRCALTVGSGFDTFTTGYEKIRCKL